MAKDLDRDIETVVDQGELLELLFEQIMFSIYIWQSLGVGLAFIAYPSALSLLPVAPLWSFLFFFMVLILGFGSEMTLIEAIVMTIVDQWPDKLRKRKIWVLLGVVITMFLSGLFMCTQVTFEFYLFNIWNVDFFVIRRVFTSYNLWTHIVYHILHS